MSEYQPRTTERLIGILRSGDQNPRSWQQEAATRLSDLVKALEECAAAFSTSPGTVSQCQAEISAEFQRRMDIAGRALSAVKGGQDGV